MVHWSLYLHWFCMRMNGFRTAVFILDARLRLWYFQNLQSVPPPTSWAPPTGWAVSTTASRCPRPTPTWPRARPPPSTRPRPRPPEVRDMTRAHSHDPRPLGPAPTLSLLKRRRRKSGNRHIIVSTLVPKPRRKTSLTQRMIGKLRVTTPPSTWVTSSTVRSTRPVRL